MERRRDREVVLRVKTERLQYIGEERECATVFARRREITGEKKREMMLYAKRQMVCVLQQ